MEQIPEHMLDELARQKLEGKSYSEIRSNLSESGFTSEQVKAVIGQVDEKVLEAETGIKHLDNARKWYRAGLVMAIAGLILAIGFNAGFILRGAKAMLAYSPFIAGILIMFYGKMMQRKPLRMISLKSCTNIV